jgi:hypothetical protein
MPLGAFHILRDMHSSKLNIYYYYFQNCLRRIRSPGAQANFQPVVVVGQVNVVPIWQPVVRESYRRT